MDLDVPLPPVDIRQGGGRHRFDDEYYLDTARSDVSFLTTVGLEPNSRLLDFGCGPGRLAIGLIASGWAGSYLGVETKAVHVTWATEEITSRYPNFEFVRVDAANARYNPVGADERRLPADDGSIDMLCAFSVFSHMLSDDSRAYLAEIRRVLHPDGRAYITAYVADDAPDETENPPWLGTWSGRLHCVLYSTDYLTRLITSVGLEVKHLGARDGRKQTGIVLGRP